LKTLIINNFQKLINKTTHNKNAFINKGVYTFLSYYSIDLAGKKVDYNEFTIIGIDGFLVVLLIKIFRLKKVKRISFDFGSLAPIVFENANSLKKTLAIVGSDSNSINEFVRFINKKYPSIKIIYYRNGYFKSINDRNDSIKQICDLSPNIVLIGMGTRHQDKYALDIWNCYKETSIYTCGGLIHQVSINPQTYPRLVNKYNLRVFYRLLNEKGILKKIFPNIFYPFIIIPFLKLKKIKLI
jgi:N-acetylglucosaminyldiphosphoundecaprenol N-acetyl-beta-D-mannosaminyltransferase